MKAAFVYWENRIAPVFDVARRACLVTAESGRCLAEVQETLDEHPVRKVTRLVELGVDTLVCGAISRSLYEMFSDYNIRVVPFVAGELRQVIQAWLHGCLDDENFAMPGCGQRGRRCRGMSSTMGEDQAMRGREGSGMGMGNGQGRRSGAGRQGRRGSIKAAGPAYACVCPQCGRRETHQPGLPCAQRICPHCGIAMVGE